MPLNDLLRKSRTFWALVAWVAVGILLAFFNRPLWDALWVLMLGVWSVYAVAGLALVGTLFWLGCRRARLIGIAVYITAFILLIFGFAVVLPHIGAAGDEFQFSLRFARLKPQYEAIVAQALAAGEVKDGETNGVRFTVDAGPPIRVAFPQPGGCSTTGKASSGILPASFDPPQAGAMGSPATTQRPPRPRRSSEAT